MKKNKKNIIILISLLCSLIIIYILIQIKNIEEKSFVKFIINDQEILIDKNTKETTFDLNTLNTEYDTK